MQREGKSLLSTVPPPTAAPHHRPSQPSALPPGLSTTAAVSQPPLSLSLPLPQTPSLAHSSPWLSTMAQPRAARKQSSERLRTTPNPLPGPCQCHQQSHPAFVHLGDTCGMCHSAPSAPHGASPPGRAHIQPQSCPRWECQTFRSRSHQQPHPAFGHSCDTQHVPQCPRRAPRRLPPPARGHPRLQSRHRWERQTFRSLTHGCSSGRATPFAAAKTLRELGAKPADSCPHTPTRPINT